jgi:hypothetical protein
MMNSVHPARRRIPSITVTQTTAPTSVICQGR